MLGAMVAIPRGRRPLPGWTPKPTWASPTGRWRLDDDEALPRVDAPRANAPRPNYFVVEHANGP